MNLYAVSYRVTFFKKSRSHFTNTIILIQANIKHNHTRLWAQSNTQSCAPNKGKKKGHAHSQTQSIIHRHKTNSTSIHGLIRNQSNTIHANTYSYTQQNMCYCSVTSHILNTRRQAYAQPCNTVPAHMLIYTYLSPYIYVIFTYASSTLYALIPKYISLLFFLSICQQVLFVCLFTHF